MSARDVIVNSLFEPGPDKLDGFSQVDRQVALKRTDAILSALDRAGYAVVPKSLLAKVQNDPPLTGLAQFDLTAKGIET